MGGSRIKTLDKLIEQILLALCQHEYEKASDLINELLCIDFDNIEPSELTKLSSQIEYLVAKLQEHKDKIKMQITQKEQLKNYLF